MEKYTFEQFNEHLSHLEGSWEISSLGMHLAQAYDRAGDDEQRERAIKAIIKNKGVIDYVYEYISSEGAEVLKTRI